MLKTIRAGIEKITITIDHFRVHPTPLENWSLAQVKILRTLARASFSNLTNKERQILIIRLGLKDGQPKTAVEAAKLLKIDLSVVQQAEQSAFNYLRSCLGSQKI